MPLLTPADIRNPKRASGYTYVNFQAKAKSKPFIAKHNSGGTNDPNRPVFIGVMRATALEAAQDYCDYVNGSGVATPATPAYPAPKVDMGTNTRHAPKVPAVTIKRTVFTGPHDLYDVLVYDATTGVVFRRKVGITARGQKRYEDIAKTFGFSIRPVSKAVTYPSKAAAEEAERAKVIEVARDTNWRQVGKESFAPAFINLPAAVQRAA